MPAGAADPALTPEVLAELAARLVPGSAAGEPEPLTGGVTAFVTALTLHGPGGPRRVVVRRTDDADDPTTLVEHHVRTALHAVGFPVARPRLADDHRTLLPTPFVVMDFVEGTTAVPVDGLDEALAQMVDHLVALHALDPDALALPALPTRDDPVHEVFAWTDDPAVHEALRRSTPPPPARRALCHGDFWPENLLWREGQLVAVLDWEDAAVGDPLSDVAVTRMELRWRYDGDVGRRASTRFTEDYLRQSRCDPARQPWWDLYVATAALTYMDRWGLPEARVAHMRRVSQAFVAEAVAALSRR